MKNATLGTRPTGTLAAIAAAIVVIAGELGLEIPEAIAGGIVVLVAIAVSYANPRWANLRGEILDAHPAGLTAVGAAVVVWIATLFGVELSSSEVAIVIGALVAIVSVRTPIGDDLEPETIPPAAGAGDDGRAREKVEPGD